jgi:uncharacterized membrane-anchored protein
MKYERDLAFNLRIRGFSEHEIAESLEDVRSHEAATGVPARNEFGTAAEYAKQFPRKSRWSRGKVVGAFATLLALAYVLVTILLMFVGIDIRTYVGPLSLMPALALVFGGNLIGFFVDYLRPAPRLTQGVPA